MITSGVITNQSTVYKNTIKFKIRFGGSNIDIGKEYEIEAYIGVNFEENMLLLGNYDDSLTEIFRSSYCIGYEDNTSKYQVKKTAAEQNIQALENSIISFNTFYASNDYRNLGNKSDKILAGIYKILTNFYQQLTKYNNKKYLNDSYRNRFDEIYRQLLTILPNIRTIEDYNNRLTHTNRSIILIIELIGHIKVRLIQILED